MRICWGWDSSCSLLKESYLLQVMGYPVPALWATSKVQWKWQYTGSRRNLVFSIQLSCKPCFKPLNGSRSSSFSRSNLPRMGSIQCTPISSGWGTLAFVKHQLRRHQPNQRCWSSISGMLARHGNTVWVGHSSGPMPSWSSGLQLSWGSHNLRSFLLSWLHFLKMLISCQRLFDTNLNV